MSIVKITAAFTFVIGCLSCSSSNNNECKDYILNLRNDSLNDSSNQTLEYFKINSFSSIEDTNKFFKYENRDKVEYFLGTSKQDSTKRMYNYFIKEKILKSDKFQFDLLALVDIDENGENVYYSLKSFDYHGNRQGEVELAYFSSQDNEYVSGWIECDSTIHMNIYKYNQHRIFKFNENGEIKYVKTINSR